jgi:hypothetical protein
LKIEIEELKSVERVNESPIEIYSLKTKQIPPQFYPGTVSPVQHIALLIKKGCKSKWSAKKKAP